MNRYIIVIIFILLIGYSCEYQTEDIYFVEKEKPIPNKEIEINLYGVRDNDIIYIYDRTWLSYDINEEFNRVLKTKITLDNMPIENSYKGILIAPDIYDNSVHKLKLYVECTTETGSIAEKFGLEKYIGEKEYTVKYVHVDKGLTITDGVSNENYLKIQWEKPNIEGIQVDKYEITYERDWSWNSKITVTITDPDLTFIVDKNYVWGYKNYEIKTYFKDNKIPTWSDRYSMNYNSFEAEDINVEEVSLEKGIVSWPKNKYRCVYLLSNLLGVKEIGAYEPEIVEKVDYSKNSAMINLSSFPNQILLSLNVLPENYAPEHSGWGEKYFNGPDVMMDKAWYFSSFSYNVNKNALYGLGEYKVIKFDAQTQKQIAITWIDMLNYHFSDKISSSSKTNNVAILSKWGTVYLLDENLDIYKKFDISNTINYESLDDVFCITDDEKIVVSGMGNSRELYIYNLDGILKYEVILPPTPFKSKITASFDGKYLSYYTSQNLKIYKLGETRETLIYDNNVANLNKCDFHPTITNKLIIQSLDSFYILDILDNEESNRIKGSYISVDPFTGNIAFYDKEYEQNRYVNIMKQDNGVSDIIGKLPVVSGYNIRLYNNFIIGSFNDHMTHNYYKNLSKYLK